MSYYSLIVTYNTDLTESDSAILLSDKRMRSYARNVPTIVKRCQAEYVKLLYSRRHKDDTPGYFENGEVDVYKRQQRERAPRQSDPLHCKSFKLSQPE